MLPMEAATLSLKHEKWLIHNLVFQDNFNWISIGKRILEQEMNGENRWRLRLMQYRSGQWHPILI